MMKKLLATFVAAVLFAPAGAVHAQDDFSFDIVESQVTDTDKQKIDDAKDLLAQERFSEALGAFESILADPKQKKAHEAIKYEVCKAFYKMGAYHASLSCFEDILKVGPKHTMFGSSREWLFFIARKIKDELGALRLIARYAKAEDIPTEYQSELGYALGRYYFLTALELGAKGVEVEAKPDAPAEETPNEGALDFGPDEGDKKEEKKDEEGGFDFGADDLGGGDIDNTLRFRPRAPADVRLAQDDDDMFGIGEATTKDEKKGKKPKAKPKGKKEEAKAEEKKDEPPPPPEPKKEKHAFEGPKSSDEALKLSLDNLGRVKKDFALYAQSLYIKGLVHFARGEFEPAVNAFQEVVRMTNPKGGTVRNDKLREMAFFSLARIHYQFEQFRYAIFYYNRVSRDSEQWLEALFESSWAHFRLAEYEKALGNLVTLQSPFFQDEYYPESAILKAITFYENCRYPEARAFLGEFEQNYGGVLEELKRLTGETGAKVASADKSVPAPSAKTATQLFEELTELEKKVNEGRDDANRSFALTARLLRLALSDKRVKGYREAIEEIDAEKAQLQALEAPFNGGATHATALADVDKRREELVALAGTLLKDKLEAEKKFLTDLNSKLVRIQFEIAKGEKDKLESRLSGSEQSTSKTSYQHITAVDDERLYWPFEGEYWRDELGTYQYTLTEGCRPPDETTITGN
jgi:outer membrane protein assembly factor BamD (BamD/ComL family)